MGGTHDTATNPTRPDRPSAGLVLAALVVALLAIGTGVAAAQSTPDVDDLAKRYGLLRPSDLPDGYEHTDVQRDTGRTPLYGAVLGDCVEIDPAVPFRGGTPVTVGAAFGADGSAREANGVELVYTFDRKADASAYYDAFAGGLEDLAACGLMVEPQGTIGTYAAFDAGTAGRERSGVTFDPRTDEPLRRFAITRTGTVVVYLELRDDTATDAEFADLLSRALKRAR